MKTKIIIISVLINLLVGFSIYSQESLSINKNEINIGYVNVFKLNNIPDIAIGYKRHFNKGAIRTNTSFYIKKPIDYFFMDISYQYKVKVKLGYEFHKNIDKLQLFYGADLLSYKSISQIQSNNLFGYLQVLTKTYGVGVSPLIGVKFYINKLISISTVTNFDTFFQKSERINYDEYTYSGEITNSTSDNTVIKLDPLCLFTINFHL